MKNSRRSISIGLITAAVATLSACGGGGGSGATAGASTSVSGVAATGLAIANGQVTLKCTNGVTSPVSTQADGSYSVDVSHVTLPCVARVDYGTAQKLHSLVRAAGTVNITPVTDMVVANLSSTGAAADAFDKFQASEVEGFTDARVSTAIQTVKTHLAALGVSTVKLPDDVIGSKLVATHGTVQGDAQDSVLDAIKTELELKNKTLEGVETEMHAGTETRPSTSTGTLGDAAAGQTAYQANCQSCHGASMPDAMNASKILAAIQENEGGMGALKNTVTMAMADNIASYLAKGVTSAPLTTQTITFASPGNQTMGVATPALVASASSGLPVILNSTTPVVCTVAGTSLTLVAPGTCNLSASQAGNATYAAAATVSNSFTVATATGAVLPGQSISFASPGAQTVGTPATLTASADSGLVVTFASTTPSVCSVSGNTLTLLSAGNCAVTANQAGNASYAAAATITQTFAVTNPASTASASNGKTLYANNSCGSCHGTPPAGAVLNAANNPTAIRSAINTFSVMNGYKGLTDQNLTDIAAYLATPTI